MNDVFSETFDAWASWRRRNKLRFELESAALDYGVKLDIVEDRRFLGSNYVIRVSGTEKNVSDYCSAVEKAFGCGESD
jgi:RNase adaptor protein for sRNA GlmZ degradation